MMVLIHVTIEDIDNINIPFRLFRSKKESTKTIQKVRNLFNDNLTKEFSTKEVYKHVYYNGGTSGYRTTQRILEILKIEGFLIKRHTQIGGSRNYWRRK